MENLFNVWFEKVGRRAEIIIDRFTAIKASDIEEAAISAFKKGDGKKLIMNVEPCDAEGNAQDGISVFMINDLAKAIVVAKEYARGERY